MSETPPLPLSKRKQIIKENIAFKRIEDIAKMCGVDDRTIYRDKDKMRKSGEWNDYIEATILKLATVGDVDDSTKFREFMKIYAKEFTDKHQVEATGDFSFNLVAWRPSDADSEDTVPTP